MKTIIPCISLIIMFQIAMPAAAAVDIDSLPSFVSPLNWDISEKEIQAKSSSISFERNSYNAEYFGKMVYVNAVIYTKRHVPFFDDAQVSVEWLDGKIIGIRVNATDADPKCWDDSVPRKHCRRDDLKGLTVVFSKVKSELEKQYGPGITKAGPSKGEQSIQWNSEQARSCSS